MSENLPKNNLDIFPIHLRDYQSLVDHINALLDGQPTTEVGDKFAKFAIRFVPQTKLGSGYETPELRPVKSHDKGVDLTANGKDGQSVLFIQSKKSVKSAEDIRGIMDGFNEFILGNQGQGEAQQIPMFSENQPTPHCLLFTLSRISGILNAYEQRASTTKDLYDQLKNEGRFHVIDGDEILSVLRAAFRRFSELPYQLTINLDTEVRQHGNVYLSVISSDEIKRLYAEFGEALFFENVRDFLGVSSNTQKGRSTPNQDIVKTLTKNPEKMLERNNGIVIKAVDVKVQKTGKQLFLTRGGIVNGCQTTMCIVDYAKHPCFVQVKIVQTEPDEAWNITKAANYQTEVPDIDLEIARSLRPQLLRRYGFISGVEVEHGKKSALQLLDDMYNTKVTYDETRLLYIGLFSRSPNNLIAGNYTELLPELVKQFHDEDYYGEQVFKVLLELERVSERGKDKVRDIFSDETLFNRYYDPDNPIYRCFVSILALCGAINMDVTERIQIGSRVNQRIEGKVDVQREFQRMKEFFGKAEILLEEKPETFLEFYISAFNVWMREIRAQGEDEAEIRQLMYTRTKRLPFSQVYTTLVNDMRTWKALGSKI